MTIESLQKIINFENELYASEQKKLDDTAKWLQEQLGLIDEEHAKKCIALEAKKKKVTEGARTETQKKAQGIIRTSQDHVKRLDSLKSADLRVQLQESISLLIGHEL